jgi:predicted transcriptional regulator
MRKKHPLIRWRERNRLSRAEFARLSRIPYTTIRAVEAGNHPRVDTIQKIWEATLRISGDGIAFGSFL